KPLAALLGALDAQMGLGIAAIGGKDSMSGSFENLDVPSTLVSFATAIGRTGDVVSSEFKKANSSVVILKPQYKDGLPEIGSLLSIYKAVEQMMDEGKVLAAYTPGFGGVAEALFKMCAGNHVGLLLDKTVDLDKLFEPCYGAIILELLDPAAGQFLGFTTVEYTIRTPGETIDLARLQELWEAKLEPVFPYRKPGDAVPAISQSYNCFQRKAPAVRLATPRVIIPVFPGTNCEYDTARAFRRAGGDPHVLVLKNLTPADVAESCEALVKEIDQAQILMLPGGFSGGDEPDGSAKFITAFFRSPAVADAVNRLLNQRDGLALGICNGFQALIKLGLVPYGEIRPITENDPTLTFNTIGRHQSMLVRTRIASNKSPWLSECDVNDEHLIAISHGEGRFVCEPQLLQQLIDNGQVATQYVDLNCVPTMDLRYNPNGSVMAIEGITSPDGRVLGKMGHSERSGDLLYKNVTGDKYQPLFEGGVNYFKL
ncbi:MAG: phosphoribosylformylglycinamidine synthase subunit PurQ, partial [Gemmiger sp.]